MGSENVAVDTVVASAIPLTRYKTVECLAAKLGECMQL